MMKQLKKRFLRTISLTYPKFLVCTSSWRSFQRRGRPSRCSRPRRPSSGVFGWPLESRNRLPRAATAARTVWRPTRPCGERSWGRWRGRGRGRTRRWRGECNRSWRCRCVNHLKCVFLGFVSVTLTIITFTWHILLIRHLLYKLCFNK